VSSRLAKLVREHGVAAIPVSAFYAHRPVRTIVRFCFAKRDDIPELRSVCVVLMLQDVAPAPPFNKEVSHQAARPGAGAGSFGAGAEFQTGGFQGAGFKDARFPQDDPLGPVCEEVIPELRSVCVVLMLQDVAPAPPFNKEVSH
jgi:hypothetical protein